VAAEVAAWFAHDQSDGRATGRRQP
jgi:hypothetical protein